MPSKSKKFELSLRQKQVLPYVLTNNHIRTAAKKSGISEKQIYVWLQEPGFRAELDAKRDEMFSNSMKMLKASAEESVLVLQALLKSESERTRLTAAREVLGFAFRAQENLELEPRLARLEELANEKS